MISVKLCDESTDQLFFLNKCSFFKKHLYICTNENNQQYKLVVASKLSKS